VLRHASIRLEIEKLDRKIMLTRIALAISLFAGTLLVANLPYAGSALAERVYNTMTRQWEDVDPMRRMQLRKNPPAKYKKRTVMVRTNERPGTIIIDTNRKFLYYIVEDNVAIRYGVGVGKEGFEWNGVVTVKRKEEWPTWTPPAEMRRREAAAGRILPASMEGGPENPLGSRALYLFQGGRDTLYRIHGTNQPWTIGLNLSSGCIRMMNKDVQDLYQRANIGTKVIVVGPNDRAERYLTEYTNPLQMIFGG
jgi:lipoprotein-anchoring transpeptidase ErfK/SrfK